MGRAFFEKSRAELFDCGVANDMSKVIHMLVWIVLTPCFCFASSVCFGSFKNLILPGFARDWCCLVSIKKTTHCTHQSACQSILFWDRCLCLSLSLLTLFDISYSGTTRFKHRISRIKFVHYFACCIYICCYGLDQAEFHQLMVIG